MIKYRFNHWLPRLLQTDGVTVGRTIYFMDSEAHPTLLRHELVHVAQYEQYGVVGFLIRYLFHYLKGRVQGLSHWDAYRAIPFEIEAYEKEKKEEVHG